MRTPQKFIAKNTLNIIVLVWLIAHMLLAGRLWIWNLFSFLPSAFFLLPLLLLIGWNLFTKNKYGALFVALALPLVWMQTDIHLATGSTSVSQKTTVTVFNWNTEYWHENNDKEKFYRFLKDQHADVYHLQEHVDYRYNPLTDIQEIQSYFPDYTLITKGEFVTLTKYPVAESFKGQEGDFLRVDMTINGKRISFYNVHIPLPLAPWLVTQPLEFLSDLRMRFHERQVQFRLLQADLRENPQDIYISGDFNTTVPMGDMRPLLRRYQDSSTVSDTFFPRTWKIMGMKLWRIDYNLVSPKLELLQHEDIPVNDLSDHFAQRVTFEL